MQSIQLKDDQNRRYSITIIVFLILVFLGAIILYFLKGYVPSRIEPDDLFILTFASFRLIRLFTYDQIMRVVRDLFLDKKEIISQDGEIMIERYKPKMGFKRSLSDLFGCPWCMGIWISFFTIFLYFAFPPIRYFALILALAGLASSFQIFMNMIGARAELYKHENNILN